MAHHNWLHSTSFSGVPPFAVHAGHDSDGATIYVGRSFHEGDHLPAKVIPSKNAAYVCWGGQEILKQTFEVLCGQNYSWIPCSGGNVPPNAVPSGITTSGETLYVGRGHCEGSLTPGKIHRSHGCLYIPYAGNEKRLDNYEVLIYSNIDSWVHSTGCNVPPNAVHAGHDSDGATVYVGRAHYEGDLLPAKVIPSKNAAYVCHSGREILMNQYEVLVGSAYVWVASGGGHVPSGAIQAGRTVSGEPLFIGRGHHAGSLTPGKIHPSHQCLYIPYAGSEVSLPSYEVLVKRGF